MKFIVFGGTGFVGRHLVSYLKARDCEVLSISRSGGANSLALDITKETDFAKINFLPDVVVNCASRVPAKGKTSKDPGFLEELFMTNVIGAVNIANWAVRKNVPKIINCSTLVVVKKPWPNPLSEEYTALPEGYHVGYSMSKLSQEQIMNECIKGSETNLMHLRLSAVYGIGMVPEGIICYMLEKMKDNKVIELTDAKKNTLDLIHVEDVCRAIHEVSVSEFGFEHEVINLARGEAVSLYGLAEVLKKLSGSGSEIKDEETEKSASPSKIDVSKLKERIGTAYKKFIPLEVGLLPIVESNMKNNN